MSWKLVGKPQTKRVTLELAQEFANAEPPQDRPLSERRMMVYEKLFRAGHFRPVTWAKAFCKETGGTYRVNGQHTSKMMAGLLSGDDADTLPEMVAVIEVYECDRLDDVAKLYATFDSAMQSRNASDINRGFSSTINQLADVDLRIINLSVSAIWYSELQDAYKQMQPQERAEAILDNYDFAVWVNKLLQGQRHGLHCHLKRMAVFAAMYKTYRKSKTAALEFWELVRDETADTPDHPTRKLSRWLMLSGKQSVNGSGLRYRVKDREFFVKCLHAWNAWRNNESTKLSYFAKAEVPDVK